MASSPKTDETRFTRFPLWRRWFGRRSERRSVRYLRSQGFKIIAMNVEDRHRLGEIDLVAVDGRTLVVVEVRSSQTKTFDELARSVDAEKQRRLSQALLRFKTRHRLRDVAARFDILAVRWPAGAKEPEFRHYRNAFETVGRFQMHS